MPKHCKRPHARNVAQLTRTGSTAFDAVPVITALFSKVLGPDRSVANEVEFREFRDAVIAAASDHAALALLGSKLAEQLVDHLLRQLREAAARAVPGPGGVRSD